MCLVGALKGYLTISAVSRNLSIGSAESLGCSSCSYRCEATCVVSPDVLKLASIPGVWVSLLQITARLLLSVPSSPVRTLPPKLLIICYMLSYTRIPTLTPSMASRFEGRVSLI